MDHLVAAMAFEAAGQGPTKFKYVAYDTGGPAIATLLSSEISVLSTGFSEAVEMVRAGEVHIIGVTAAERVLTYPEAPILKEQGYDVDFVNWRGVFAAPGLPSDWADEHRAVLAKMYDTPRGRRFARGMVG